MKMHLRGYLFPNLDLLSVFFQVVLCWGLLCFVTAQLVSCVLQVDTRKKNGSIQVQGQNSACTLRLGSKKTNTFREAVVVSELERLPCHQNENNCLFRYFACQTDVCFVCNS